VQNCEGPGRAAGSNCSNGAYIPFGFRPIQDGTNLADFKTMLDAIPTVASNKDQNYQGKEIYFEFFRYLTGQGVYNGHNGYCDRVGNDDPTCANPLNLPDDTPALAWDPAIQDDPAEVTGNTDYMSPLAGGTCNKVYAINFIFQNSTQEDDSDTAIKALKDDGGMEGINLTGANNNLETVVKYMYDVDLGDDTFGDVPEIDKKQNVTSFFLSPSKFLTSPTAKTHDYALAGSGNKQRGIAMSSDPETLVEQLVGLINDILSVSTTFVAASVPVNVFNRSEFLDNVFLAIFQTDDLSKPRWDGNVKRLKLDLANSQVVDANNNAAFAIDGRIDNNALTFWTDPTGYDVVAADTGAGEVSGYDGRSVDRGGAGQGITGFLDPSDSSTNSSPELQNSDAGARQMYTTPTTAWTPGTPTALIDLDATAAMASTLWPYLNGCPNCTGTTDANSDSIADSYPASGSTRNAISWSSSSTYAGATSAGGSNFQDCAAGTDDQDCAVALLRFTRGMDVEDLVDGDNDVTEATYWMMGDPMHSRPLPINYGARTDSSGDVWDTTNPDIRVMVATNRGVLHMFRNTKPRTNVAVDPVVTDGSEVWAYMPHETMNILYQLNVNDPANTPIEHPYGIDGTPTAYIKDVNNDGTIDADGADNTAGNADDDKVWLFFGLRRGGKSYYAMDLSDPDNPKILWTLKKTSGGDFDQLGLTFSIPRVANLSWDDSGIVTKPVLIFAGGYDVNKDDRSLSGVNGVIGTNDSEGRAIYVVDAETGALVWKAEYGATTGVSGTNYLHSGLLDSIPSDITAVDTSGDGKVDRLYVGDTGGNIWRADLNGTDRTAWTLTKLASLGRHTTSNKANDRRFFHRPDFVKFGDDLGKYDAVIIESGDRANPLDLGSDGDPIPNETQNYLYMIKDRAVNPGSPRSAVVNGAADPLDGSVNTILNYSIEMSEMADLTDNCYQEVGATCDDDQKLKDDSNVVKNLANGWYVKLEQATGEKGLATPLTLGGVIFYTTYLPGTGANTCGPDEGSGIAYALDINDASAVINFNTTNTEFDNNGEVVTELQVEDRIIDLGPGIPAEPVYVGQDSVLMPPSIVGVNVRLNYKTFWFQKN
jgi:type IV pilus assembly protein PilY1